MGHHLKFLGAGLALVAAWLLAAVSPAMADDFFPHPANATWQYSWKDTTYDPSGTVENVIVQQQSGPSFTLAWADSSEQPPKVGASVFCGTGSDLGTMVFQDSSEGLLEPNPGWNACPPPSNMPILCSSANTCANSLYGTLFDVIWGNRVPVVSEPLLQGVTWNATGGASNEVSSTSRYLGMRLVKVPAFPNGVMAAAVKTDLILAGTPGDEYGSGIRTTWWARGVGPVLVVFDHADGSVTTASLLATNQKPTANPPDQDYFPLKLGSTARYKWTNSKHMRHPEVEKVTVAAAANRTAKISVKSLSGLMRVVGQYLFTQRLDGVRNTWGTASAASLVKFPRLGHRRHFFTPIDLMVFGFNPVIPAYPQAGETWKSGNAVDLQHFGVTGTTRIVGIRRVHVPAGTFNALELKSTLKQRGFRFGSGVRTMWFAPGRGLVKLVFKHRDGSTSLIQLLK